VQYTGHIDLYDVTQAEHQILVCFLMLNTHFYKSKKWVKEKGTFVEVGKLH